jgi:hypothetical protein
VVGNDMWVVGKVEFGDFALERHRSNSPVVVIRRKRLRDRPSRPRHIELQLCCRAGRTLSPAPPVVDYAVRMVSDLSPEIAACAAARRAMGTR